MVIRIADLHICSDFVLFSKESNRKLFDSRIDGGDISPLLSFAPVLSIETKDSVLWFTVSEELNLEGE